MAHLSMLSGCFNVEGKEGWDCTGKRRKCGEGHCCGKHWLEDSNEAIKYTCEK